MRPFYPTILSVLLLIISFPSFSQTVAAPDKVQLMIEYVGDEVHYDPVDPQSDLSNDDIKVTLIVKLPQGQSISKVHVVAGTTSGGDDICDLSFNSDGTSLPTGTTYNLRGRNAFIGLGEYSGKSTVYADVSLEDSQGNRSTVNTASF